jgi:membrane protein required for colicin V production
MGKGSEGAKVRINALYLFENNPMEVVDIVLALLLAYGFIMGLKNGLIVEIASVAALIAAVYGAIHFSYFLADYLAKSQDWNGTNIKVTAFVGTFLAIVIAVHLLAKLLTRVARLAMLGFLNRLAGGVFGLVKVAVILGALIIYLERAGISPETLLAGSLENSVLYPPLRETGALVFSLALEP